MTFARALFTVSGLTVLSRVAGFVRDTMTAMFLGAGPVADAFFVAQRLPNLFRSLFAEGAFSAAFVPLYTSENEKGGPEAARRFAGEALALLLAVLIPFSALMIFGMPWVILVLAPGFTDDPEKFDLTVTYGRIAFPYLALISVTALQSGVLNANGRFGPGAAAPVLYNLVMIAALLATQLLDWAVGDALIWAVSAAGVVQALWLGWHCRRAARAIPLLVPHLTEAGKTLFRRIGPGAIGAGAAQINIMVSTVLASMLPTGAVAWLFYADRLNQLPLGIVGIAVATTLLPILSRHVANGKEELVRHYTSRAIEFCLALGLPAFLGLSILATPILQTLFERGAFTAKDTAATAAALAAYAPAIPAFLLVKVLSARCFARHDTKTPVKMALIAMAVNVIAAAGLLWHFVHVGIAFALSLATWTNAALLTVHLRRRGEPLGDALLARRAPLLILCALGMAATCWGLRIALDGWFTERHLLLNASGLGLAIGGSGAVYVLLLQLTGAFRWSEARALLTRKEP